MLTCPRAQGSLITPLLYSTQGELYGTLKWFEAWGNVSDIEEGILQFASKFRVACLRHKQSQLADN